MAKRPIKITYADGSVRFVKANHFQRQPRKHEGREWRRLRDRVLTRDGHQCRACRSERDLQVHHLYGRQPLIQPTRNLITLCQRCHTTHHQWLERGVNIFGLGKRA